MLWLIVVLIILVVLVVKVFMRRPQFGRLASGDRLDMLRQSPHYKNGQFQNLSHTPALTEGTSYYKVLREFFFQKSKRGKPTISLPSKKVDLSQLDPLTDLLVWFGHSSYFMQLHASKINKCRHIFLFIKQVSFGYSAFLCGVFCVFTGALHTSFASAFAL